MKHGLNFDETDSNYMLLNEIFKIIGSRESKQIMSRNGLKPLNKVISLVKTVILAAYFECSISFVVDELKRSFKLRKYARFEGEIEDVDKIYECLARFSAEEYYNFVNHFLNRYNQVMRKKNKTLIVDATLSACDFNYDKQYIPPKHFEELNLK